jgi:hypothetical protein
MSTHNYSFAEAMKVVNCSESTLRRKLQSEGLKLGATKGKKGWVIPITVLEAMGLIDTVKPYDTSQMTPTDTSKMNEMKVRIATLEERCKGQDMLLAALREQLSDKDRSIRLLEAKPTTRGGGHIGDKERRIQEEEDTSDFSNSKGFWRKLFGK